MCLILRGDGHLTAKIIVEQIWPQITTHGKLEFLECYDFILRNHGTESLTGLDILSPQNLHTKKKTIKKPVTDGIVEKCDWVRGFAPLATDEETGIAKLKFIFTEDAYRAKAINYQLRESPTWNLDDSQPPARGILAQTGMTTARLEFEDEHRMEPFCPDRSDQTTYWIRIALKPTINHRITPPLAFGSDTLQIQPCEILSADQVLSICRDKLNVWAENSESPVQESAVAARRLLLDETFESPDSSLRVESHFLSLVTGRKFMQTNMMVEGPCGFLGVQDPYGMSESPIAKEYKERQPAMSRTWYMGGSHYRSNDPFELARLVCRHLKDFAGPGKTKEMISTAVAHDQHRNVCHVVEALKDRGVLDCDKDSDTYRIREPDRFITPFDGNPLGTKDGNFTPFDEWDKYAFFADVLFGQLGSDQVNPHRDSRFEPKGARIHYDLLFDKPA